MSGCGELCVGVGVGVGGLRGLWVGDEGVFRGGMHSSYFSFSPKANILTMNFSTENIEILQIQ